MVTTIANASFGWIVTCLYGRFYRMNHRRHDDVSHWEYGVCTDHSVVEFAEAEIG